MPNYFLNNLGYGIVHMAYLYCKLSYLILLLLRSSPKFACANISGQCYSIISCVSCQFGKVTTFRPHSIKTHHTNTTDQQTNTWHRYSKFLHMESPDKSDTWHQKVVTSFKLASLLINKMWPKPRGSETNICSRKAWQSLKSTYFIYVDTMIIKTLTSSARVQMIYLSVISLRDKTEIYFQYFGCDICERR